ncbi:MAG TPA: SMP-30/gluconolactonase/LRE family protein [Oleiagrimonas sp.]|nr:SMP-30/gluconolactonase/LRE family protein [Oleiagrimonas sp.]
MSADAPATSTTIAKATTVAITHTQSATPGPLFVAHDFVGDDVFGHGIEGPTVGPDGTVYVVGYGPKAGIAAVATQADGSGKASAFLNLADGRTPNALQYTTGGDIYVADYTGHNVLRIDMATDKVSVYAHLEGAHQPNDIAFAPDGTIYASDPDWKNGTGQLWKITPGGHASVIETGMGTTNGIEVSPDGKHLYVNESVQRKVWKYDIEADGSLSHKRLLLSFDDAGLDGMRCDTRGNLYIARYGAGRVLVVSPEGQILHKVELKGQDPTNLAFGGDDKRRVYVTLQDRGAIETFRSKYPGRPYPPSPKSGS